jgi:hypothetical protein
MLYHQELHCLHNQNSEMKNIAINIRQQYGIFIRLTECCFSFYPFLNKQLMKKLMTTKLCLTSFMKLYKNYSTYNHTDRTLRTIYSCKTAVFQCLTPVFLYIYIYIYIKVQLLTLHQSSTHYSFS